MNDQYNHEFYKDRHTNTVYSAEKILSIVKNRTKSFDSVVDFGCGVGTWLKVSGQLGACNVKGLDGPWVDKKLLQIDPSDFKVVDFESEVVLDEKFDLAISLEVAEHISEKSANFFVDSLCNVSDFVLFSAAIPNQGGKGHLNEQWPSYWATLFKIHQFVPIDIIRWMIWDDDKVPYWYRQNTVLFVHEGQLANFDFSDEEIRDSGNLLSVVHPKLLERITGLQKSVYHSWFQLLSSVRYWLNKKFRK